MITIVGNLKGGTGKSTVVFNLAVWLETHGKKTQVLDLDPQATVTDVTDIRREDGYEPMFSLSNHLSDLDNKSFQEVLIDIGMLGVDEFKKALAVADRIVIPVPPSQADVWATQRFIEMINEHAKKSMQRLVFINRADTHTAIRETDEAEEALKTLSELTYMPTRLYQRTAYRRSFSEGLAVFEQSANSKAAKEIQMLAGALYL